MWRAQAAHRSHDSARTALVIAGIGVALGGAALFGIVAHTRIPENITLEQLGKRCPRLAAGLGESCTEEAAAKLGAVLFNRSR